jgi:hypothetical protein
MSTSGNPIDADIIPGNIRYPIDIYGVAGGYF